MLAFDHDPIIKDRLQTILNHYQNKKQIEKLIYKFNLGLHLRRYLRP